MKYFFMIFFGVLILSVTSIMSMVYNTQQNSNLLTTAQVEGILESSIVGKSRGEELDGGVNKKELVGNLVESIVQRSTAKTKIRIKYIFFDENGKVVPESGADDSVDSVQFKVQILEKNRLTGEIGVVSESIRRLSLNMVTKRTGKNVTNKGEQILVKEIPLTGYTSPDAVEEEIIVEGIGKLISVGKGANSTGSVTLSKGLDLATESFNVRLAGATPTPTLDGNGNIQILSKYIPQYDTAYYSDADGYKGVLVSSLIGDFFPKEVKYIYNYDKREYRDGEGFAGNLLQDESTRGLGYIPRATKYVTNEVEADYEDTDGYKGILQPYEKIVGYDEKQIEEANVKVYEKYVENHPQADYSDAEGYKGVLDSVQTKDTKFVTKTISYPNEVHESTIWQRPTLRHIDEEGRIGTLELKQVNFVPNGNERPFTTYTGEQVDADELERTKPTTEPTGQGYWKLKTTYKANRLTDVGQRVMLGGNTGVEDGEEGGEDDGSDGEGSTGSSIIETVTDAEELANVRPYLEDYIFIDKSTSVTDFKRAGGHLNFEMTVDEFKKSETGIQNYFLTPTSKVEPVVVAEWEWIKREGSYAVIYAGEVNKDKLTYEGTVYKTDKPELVKWNTETHYRGEVVREEEGDKNRVGYSGIVEKPEQDTRRYTYSGNVTKIIKGAEELGKSYNYVVRVEYVRKSDLK